MKKTLSILLVLTLVLLSACGGNDVSSDLTSSVPSSATDVSSETSSNETPAYLNLTCRNFSSIKWQTVRIKNPATNIAFQFKIPSDWTISAEGSGTYNILRSGKKIGVISTSRLESAEKIFEYSTRFNEDTGLSAFRQTNCFSEDGSDVFYRAFRFSDYPFSLYMSIDYTELDETATYTLFESVDSATLTVPFVPLSKTNGSKNILILGNSFISTSKIGEFLNDMLTTSGSGYTVTAISVGNATVKTFIDNTQLCNDIRRGEYCYVFQCGLYAMANVTYLDTMKAICNSSNTNLVIFPAHNEFTETINNARLYHGDTIFLDWKSEINDLINMGVNVSDFCIDDSVKHSTPLAGYVGAHMIYRNLFNELPPETTAASPLTMNYVRSLLGDYPETFDISFIAQEFTGKEYEID